MNELAGDLSAEISPSSMARRSTVTQRLELRRDALKRDLALVEDALTAMEQNPEAARLVDAISKLGHI